MKNKQGKLASMISVKISDGALSDEAEEQEYCSRECGYQDQSLAIILGGITARDGDWPWNAGIKQLKESMISK